MYKGEIRTWKTKIVSGPYHDEDRIRLLVKIFQTNPDGTVEVVPLGQENNKLFTVEAKDLSDTNMQF